MKYDDGIPVAGRMSDPIIWFVACLILGLHFPAPVRHKPSSTVLYYRCTLCGKKITVKQFNERH